MIDYGLMMKKLLLVLALVLTSAPALASGSRNDDDTAKLQTIDDKWLIHTTTRGGSVSSATVSLQADNGGLLFGCSERNNDLFVMLVVGKGIHKDIEKIQYRIGSDQYTDQDIEHGKLGTTLIMKDPAAFIEKLKGGRSLAVRVSLENGQKKDVTFDLRGIDKVIPPVRDACAWR
jgi:hypothetical protein